MLSHAPSVGELFLLSMGYGVPEPVAVIGVPTKAR